GIRDKLVTGVQTCALPISSDQRCEMKSSEQNPNDETRMTKELRSRKPETRRLKVVGFCLLLSIPCFLAHAQSFSIDWFTIDGGEIGRASCRGRVEVVGAEG